MECKKFNYKNYKNCTFEVGNYVYNKQVMSIQIVNEEFGDIATCTVNMPDYMYYPDTTTIKNYSENKGMTQFLIDLDIIDCVITKRKCNVYATGDETIDFCEINVDELKKYSSKFEYEYEF